MNIVDKTIGEKEKMATLNHIFINDCQIPLMSDEKMTKLIDTLRTHYLGREDYEGQIIVSYEHSNMLGPDHHNFIMIPRVLFPEFK